MANKRVFLNHCGAKFTPRNTFKVSHNNPLANNYTPFFMIYKGTCPVCKSQIMARQAIDDFGENQGAITLIKPTRQANWQEAINSQGTSWFEKGHTHVWGSRRSIPYNNRLVLIN